MVSEKNDMQMAEATYNGFISFAKWGTIAAVVITAFVILVIS
ncbi:MAG: aa3-type cytochrome c oxidase subunit IV [Sphingobium sp.]